MSTAALIPVSEYLSSIYHPDCDYVEGELEERNMGEELHAEIQSILVRIVGNHRHEWAVRVLTEQRVQLTPTRFRIPDICIVPRERPRGRIIGYPPLLCIEILSPEDRMHRMQGKVNEFAAFGVRNIWVVDPWERIGYYASPRGFEQPEDGTLRVAGTPIAITLADVFAELDEV